MAAVGDGAGEPVMASTKTVATRFEDFHEEVRKLVHKNLEEVLGGKEFDSAQVATWTMKISEACLTDCRALGHPFKFVANCTVLQRVGAGLHTSSSCLWNSQTDGSCTLRWESAAMYAIVSVYGLAL